MAKSAKTATVAQAAPELEKFYRIKRISPFEYQLLAVEVDLAKAEVEKVGKTDLKGIILSKAERILCE